MAYDPYETVWEFNTARFRITLGVKYEDDINPEDSFEFPEDIDFARSGQPYAWFSARIQVIWRDIDNPRHWASERQLVLGEDYLGECSYRSLEDFKGEGYFHDMISTAISEARDKIASIKTRMRNNPHVIHDNDIHGV